MKSFLMAEALSLKGGAFLQDSVYWMDNYLRAAIVVSLLSIWVLVGLFFYLNHYTKRRYFTLWAAGWMFYALWLTLNLVLPPMENIPWQIMLKQWCISTTAFFIFWGSARFLGQHVSQLQALLLMLFLYVWSYYGAYWLSDDLQVRLPIFGLISLASFRVSSCYYLYRRRRNFIGAGLLAAGFLLWGVFHAGYPFLYRFEELFGVGFFVSAVLQLFIAVSMIVLALEEVRHTHGLVAQNLFEQSRAKEKLALRAKGAETRYQSLFQQASQAILIVHAQTKRLMELNPAAERLLGVDRETALQKSLEEYLPSIQSTDGGWLAGLLSKRTLSLRRGTGRWVPVEITGAEVEIEGVPACQLFIQELTERALLEQQLRQSEKLAALGQMISGVAHELNNPLTVVKGYLELILQTHDLPAETRAGLEKAVHEANRAAKLVQNFLNFARQHPPQRTAVEINEIIHRVMDLRKFSMQVSGVDVVLELADDLPKIQADPDQIQQVLVVLINNAFHAMSGTGRHGRLRITSRRDGERVQVRVQDNGPGVPPHLEKRIFEPFFTTKEVGAGTGLGLSIAYSIITEHKGRLYLERPPEGGACFVFELPISVPAELAAEAGASTGESELLREALRPARVLVIDDEELIAELLSEILQIIGHQPTIRNSAIDALDLLKRQSFDVIISDMRMPQMSGAEFHAALSRQNPDLARRIIFLTGDTVSEEVVKFLKSTGNPHLAKPFQLDGVRKVIDELLARFPPATTETGTKAAT